MSYGTDVPDDWRHPSVYASAILEREKPADFLFQQSVKVERVNNLKTTRLQT